MTLNLSSIQSPLDDLMVVTGVEDKRLARDLIASLSGMLRSMHNFPNGQPQVERAKVVGPANAANPIAYVLSGHRVKAKNAGLKSYAWGAEHKQWLLDSEGALLKPAQPLELSFAGF